MSIEANDVNVHGKQLQSRCYHRKRQRVALNTEHYEDEWTEYQSKNMNPVRPQRPRDALQRREESVEEDKHRVTRDQIHNEAEKSNHHQSSNSNADTDLSDLSSEQQLLSLQTDSISKQNTKLKLEPHRQCPHSKYGSFHLTPVALI